MSLRLLTRQQYVQGLVVIPVYVPRSLCQDQAVGQQGQAHRQEKENVSEDGEPQPVLQREFYFCR